MRKDVLSLVVAALALCVAGQAWATPSICDADSGNLVQNCGFEDGTYTSGSDTSIPVDWTALGDWDTGYNGVRTDVEFVGPNSGNDFLTLSNFSSQSPMGGVSQTLSDAAGATYQVSFYFTQNDTNSATNEAFEVLWNGVVEFDQTGGTGSDTYEEYSFDVIGTGSDVLELEGFSNDGYNYIDDVEVNLVSPAPVPEPVSLAIFATGLIGAGAARRRQRRAR